MLHAQPDQWLQSGYPQWFKYIMVYINEYHSRETQKTPKPISHNIIYNFQSIQYLFYTICITVFLRPSLNWGLYRICTDVQGCWNSNNGYYHIFILPNNRNVDIILLDLVAETQYMYGKLAWHLIGTPFNYLLKVVWLVY